MKLKNKLFVIVLILILGAIIAAFTLKINSTDKSVTIMNPGTLYIGGISNLIITPGSNTEITQEEIDSKEWIWTSSDTNVIRFDSGSEEEAINAVGYGTSVITVTDSAKEYVGSLTINIPRPEISIEEALASIYDPTNGFVVNKNGYQALTLNVSKLAIDNYETNWIINDNSIIELIENDSVKALKAGLATVTAKIHTAYGDFESEPLKITVPGISLNKNTTNLNIGEKENLVATVYPANSVVTWSSNRTNIVSTNDEEITAIRNGNAVVSATMNYNEITESATCNVTVNPITINDISSTNELNVGQNAKLSLENCPEDATIGWNSNDEQIVKVDAEGNATAMGIGKATVTVTINYNGNTFSNTIDINVNGLVLSSKSETLSVDSTLTLFATTYPEQDVIWESSDESIATIPEPGCVYGMKDGTVVITATTIDGKYSDSCTIKVVKPAVREDEEDKDDDDTDIIKDHSTKDDSTTSTILPYTGLENIIKIVIAISALVGITMFVLYKKNKDVK